MAIIHGEAAREKLLEGIDELAEAVASTLGPKGRNIAMHQKAALFGADYGARAAAGAHVLITNDGVTIAKEISFADPVKNMGAQLMKEAAVKANDEAGDGTTTAIVLAQSILQGAFKNIAAGADPLALRPRRQSCRARSRTSPPEPIRWRSVAVSRRRGSSAAGTPTT